MSHPLTLSTGRRLAVIALFVLATTMTACGGSDDSSTSPAKSSPSDTAPAVQLDKKTDTAATAKSASATKVPADQLKAQAVAIESGLKDAGFAARNYGKIGGATADIVVDTSWAVYVYESDRAAAEFTLALKEILKKPANYKLFRIDNRIYYATMASALSDADKAKLDKMAAAAEGAIASE